MERQPKRYDAIIIGSGQAGTPLAPALAAAGRRTALVERAHVGGTCINVGCTPTKAMVASARVAYLARRAADFGVRVPSVEVDQGAVRRRKQAILETSRQGSLNRIERAEGVDLIRGEARFTGPKTVAVRLAEGGEMLIGADTIFVNTGGSPYVPPVPGLESLPYLDSTSVTELDEVPEHLLILGGGYIGLEFGQMFRRFGAEVTIVETRSRLMGREDPDVCEEMARILREDGVNLIFEARATRAERNGDDLRLHLDTPAGARRLSCSHLLLGAGRRPNTDGLDLAAAGVETDERGYIKVNERLETNVPGIYALGDVNGGPAFTHISYDDYRIVRANLLEGGNASTKDRVLPYVVYTDPELGRVGLSEEQARAQGRDVRVAKVAMDRVSRAFEMGETRGFIKAVVDAGTKRILGAAVLGVHGGELMAAIQVAMLGGLPYTALQNAIFAHPTLAEALNNLFGSLEG